MTLRTQSVRVLPEGLGHHIYDSAQGQQAHIP